VKLANAAEVAALMTAEEYARQTGTH
jgi:hypothetical protein